MSEDRRDIEDIKNDAHDNEDFQKALKIAAATDAKHDLADSFLKFFKTSKYTSIGTPQEKEDTLKSSGWDVVKLMIQGYDDKKIPDVWEKNTYDPYIFEQKVLTNYTNYEYSVSSLKIKTDVTTPEKLYEFLAGESEEFIVIWDATTGPFTNILFDKKKGAGDSKTRQMTIIVNREAISDPSGKPNEESSLYKDKANEARVVQIKIANETKLEKTPVFYPYWDAEPRTSYRNDFFSNYNITLDPIEFNKRKSTKIIFADDKYKKESKIETTKEGKLTNSKLGMASVLNTLYEKFMKGSNFIDSLKEKDYHISLQQKRSGDTLMCLSYFDEARKYIIHGSKSEVHDSWTLKKKRSDNIPIFVLTHDTFNTLPIGLANGVNIIYTGASTSGGSEQHVYKFERDKKDIDYTQTFFDNYIKKEGGREEILALFKEQSEIYEKNISDLAYIINEYFIRANTLLPEADEYIENNKDKRIVVDTYIKDKLTAPEKGLNLLLQLITEALYKYALYKKYVDIPRKFSELQGIINTLKDRSYTGDTIVSTETIRSLYYSQKEKKYQPFFTESIDKVFETYKKEKRPIKEILYNDTTDFGKEFQKNNNVKEGIRGFDYFKIRSSWDVLYYKRTKYVFGIAPELISLLSPRDRAYLIDFTDLLRTIEDKKYIKADIKKNFSNVWEYIHKEDLSLYEGTDRYEFMSSIHKSILNEVDPDIDPDVNPKAVSTNNADAKNNEESTVNAVNTNSVVLPYHKILVNECSSEAAAIIIEKLNDILNEIAPEIEVSNKPKSGGGVENIYKEKFNRYSFYRMLCINYLIMSNQYSSYQKQNMKEMDVYGANIPILGTILLDFIGKNISVESFMCFFLFGMYIGGHQDQPIRVIQQTLCPNSPFFYHFPEVLQEFTSLSTIPNHYETLQKSSDKFGQIFPILFTNSMPQIPDISTASFEKTDAAIRNLYRTLEKQQTELYENHKRSIQKSLVQSSKIHAPLRLVSGKQSIAISATAGGAKPKKTRRSTRKSNRRTRKHRRSK